MVYFLVASRGLHAKQAGTGYAAARPLLLGAVTAVGAYTAYTTYRNSDGVIVPQATVHAKDLPSAQPSVSSLLATLMFLLIMVTQSYNQFKAKFND